MVAAAMLWGTTGTVQTLLPAGREPLAVGAFRILFGAMSLLGLVLIQKSARSAVHSLPFGGVLLAGVSNGLYNLFFFWAVSEAGVGVGTAVTIGSGPFWVTAYEAIALKRRPGRIRVFGQCLSILGVGVLGSSGGGPDGSLLGIGLALCAGACYATYSVTTSRIAHRAPSTTIAAATFVVAAMVTLPVLFVVPLDWLAAPTAWMALIFLGVGATGLSYALYTWGLTRVPVSTAVTLVLAEPLTAWLLATIVVGEAVTLRSASGAFLILVGLAIVTSFPAKGVNLK